MHFLFNSGMMLIYYCILHIKHSCVVGRGFTEKIGEGYKRNGSWWVVHLSHGFSASRKVVRSIDIYRTNIGATLCDAVDASGGASAKLIEIGIQKLYLAFVPDFI